MEDSGEGSPCSPSTKALYPCPWFPTRLSTPCPEQAPTSQDTCGSVAPHSPSITAVPAQQGVIGALQEVEVPFGNQKPPRRHVSTQMHRKHTPTSHTREHTCVPKEATQLLPVCPLPSFTNSSRLQGLPWINCRDSGLSHSDLVPTVKSEFTRSPTMGKGHVSVCIRLPHTYLIVGLGLESRGHSEGRTPFQ